MTKRQQTIAGLAGFTLLCLAASVAVLDKTGPAIVGVSGEAPTAAGWLATLLPLLGASGGLFGTIYAWLSKAAPLINSGIGGITNIGGEHAAVLGAIIAGLNFSTGRAAESKGEASLNGGKLVWSFTFTPDESFTASAIESLQSAPRTFTN